MGPCVPEGGARRSGGRPLRHAGPEGRIHAKGWPKGRISRREGTTAAPAVCFNGVMGSHGNIATGRDHDLEPFWPSRQHHDFDRVCCRATNAQAL
ncbi:hypothetical protein GCM10010277_26340 [Streptomyces longisporoflavus]|nr:hypothetical protein GCM10010277_26340 [Streptomyces longisporoflavus]